METVTLFIILGCLVLTALAMLRLRDGLTAVMLAGLYSLLAASAFVLMDAVDVAFTEAAVGAGISTVLLLATLHRTSRITRRRDHAARIPLLVVMLAGAMLIHGTLDMPRYGDPHAPIHQRVGSDYLREATDATGVPNVVSAVLASYRGYDTLGETTVVLTAAVGVLALLRNRRQDRGDG